MWLLYAYFLLFLVTFYDDDDDDGAWMNIEMSRWFFLFNSPVIFNKPSLQPGCVGKWIGQIADRHIQGRTFQKEQDNNKWKKKNGCGQGQKATKKMQESSRKQIRKRKETCWIAKVRWEWLDVWKRMRSCPTYTMSQPLWAICVVVCVFLCVCETERVPCSLGCLWPWWQPLQQAKESGCTRYQQALTATTPVLLLQFGV